MLASWIKGFKIEVTTKPHNSGTYLVSLGKVRYTNKIFIR